MSPGGVSEADAVAQLQAATAAMTRLAERARIANAGLRAAVANARLAADRSRRELETVRAGWEGELDRARGRIEQLRAARAVNPGATGGAGEVAARVAALRAVVSALESQGVETLSSTGSRATGLQESLSTRLTACESAMAEVNEATDVLLTDVDDKAIGVEERLASWASSAKTSTETLLGALSGLSERFRGRVESLSEHLDGSVNEGSVRVEATFLSQAIQSLEAAALGARAASALLSKARDEGVGEFDGALSGVLGKIRPILDVIQTIKPVLELARTML